MERRHIGWIGGGLVLAVLMIAALAGALLIGDKGVRAAYPAAPTRTPGPGTMGGGMMGAA